MSKSWNDPKLQNLASVLLTDFAFVLESIEIEGFLEHPSQHPFINDYYGVNPVEFPTVVRLVGRKYSSKKHSPRDYAIAGVPHD